MPLGKKHVGQSRGSVRRRHPCSALAWVGCAEPSATEPIAGDPQAEETGTTTFGGTDTGGPGSTGGPAEDPSESGDGGSFIGNPDDGDDGLPDISCDVWTQDCPAGEKCTAYIKDGGTSWDATKCVDVVDSPETPGSVCTATNGGSGDDDCDYSGMCWGVDEMGLGYCVALCTGNAQSNACSDPDTSCVIVNDGVLNLCLPDCHPLLQDCPIDAEGCYPGPEGFSCAPDVSNGAGAGEPCSGINTCAGGTYCEDASVLEGCNGPSCCTEFCATDEADDCGGALECTPLSADGQAQPGQENVGGCVLPG